MVEFNVAFCPLQMAALLTVTTGKGLTTIVAGVLALTQPAGEVYTRLYVVVAAGEPEMEEVVCPPGLHAKVPPGMFGVAESVAVCPAQTVSFGMLKVGMPFTVTVTG